MANYAKINIGSEGRVELHDKLALTGAEISVNRLPAGAGVPFVHAHKNNEEIYGVLEGKGKAVLDGEEIARHEAPVLRVARLRHHLRLHSDSRKLPRRLHRRRRDHVLMPFTKQP